jgi:hypothetical protein
MIKRIGNDSKQTNLKKMITWEKKIWLSVETQLIDSISPFVVVTFFFFSLAE